MAGRVLSGKHYPPTSLFPHGLPHPAALYHQNHLSHQIPPPQHPHSRHDADEDDFSGSDVLSDDEKENEGKSQKNVFKFKIVLPQWKN